MKINLFLDVEILSKTIHIVEEGLKSIEKPLNLAQRAMLIALLYERCFRNGDLFDREVVNAYLKLFC